MYLSIHDRVALEKAAIPLPFVDVFPWDKYKGNTMNKENIHFCEVRPRKDLSGKKFGMLTVLKPVGKTKHRQIVYECACDCGNHCFVSFEHLSFGDTKSCSLCKPPFGSLNTTKKKDLYRLWDGMIQRCNNPKATSYKNYGARGIGVCGRWLSSFDNFLNDMGERPFHAAQLDRKNNNGDYSPENCRWVSVKENCNNTRSNHKIEIDGIVKTVSQWAEMLGVNDSTLRSRIVSIGEENAVRQYMK